MKVIVREIVEGKILGKMYAVIIVSHLGLKRRVYETYFTLGMAELTAREVAKAHGVKFVRGA